MGELVVFDMEWNMGYAPKTFLYQGVEQVLRGEIIQIGAVKLRDGKLADRFSVLLKPSIFPRLHDHVAKVTGLSQKQLDAGMPIAEGLRQFIQWCGPDAQLAEWGLDDVPVLRQNLVLYGLEENWPCHWYDVQKIFTTQHPRQPGESMTLEAVVERMGIKKQDSFHDALSDAVYTAQICTFLDMEKGIQEYPTEERLLQELLCPADKNRQDYTSWPKSADGETWCEPSMRQASCPHCGAPLELDDQDIWLRKGNNSMYSLAQCKEHGPVMIWLRRMCLDGLLYSFARATEVADEQQTKKWQKERRAALARAERKKQEMTALALERVKNAGR